MIEVSLQMFDGRGGGSGGGGGGSGENSMPKWLNSDIIHPFTVRIMEGKKTREETFIGTQWQMKQQEINWIENHLGMTYKEYLNQTRYSYQAVIDGPNDARIAISYEKNMEKNGSGDPAGIQRAIKQYREDKKNFHKRYSNFIKGK